MKVGLAAVFAVALALPTGSVSASPLDDLDPAARQALVAWEHDYQQALDQHGDKLVARGDSGSLLAAAELTVYLPLGVAPVDEEQRSRRRVIADALLARAIVTEPVEPLALWLAANRCAQGDPGCSRIELWQRLADADPENAMVWLALATQAHGQGDLARSDRYFAQAVSQPRYDAYEVDYGRLLLAAHEGFRAPDLAPELSAALFQWASGGNSETNGLPFDLVDMLMMGRWAAHVFPAMSDITVFCPVREAESERMSPLSRQDCRQFLGTMYETASNLLTQLTSLSYLARLTQGEEDGPTWLEALRQASWRHQQFRELSSASPGFEIVPDYIRRVLNDGELAALSVVLEARGRLPEALEGWVPEHGTARELLLGED